MVRKTMLLLPSDGAFVQHRLDLDRKNAVWVRLANFRRIRLDGRRRPELHRMRDGVGRLGEGGRSGRRSCGGLSPFGRFLPLLPKNGGAGRQEGRGISPVPIPHPIQSL